MAKPKIPLDELRREVEQCRRCPLCEGRTNVVFGSGNEHARVLIIGEAPGKNEDLQGMPFVGAAGKYLSELIVRAGLEREDVYIANILKCRPPDNRNPLTEEIQACTPFLREQTRTIDPEVIVTLGNFSTRFVLKTDRGITGLRGQFFDAGKFKVMPTFHPAAALYDVTKREKIEADFEKLGAFLKEHANDLVTIEHKPLRSSSDPSDAPKKENVDPCIRAESEDDDGYDPYSDRVPTEQLFEEDPWK